MLARLFILAIALAACTPVPAADTYAAAAAYSRNYNGRSLLILKGGAIVYEEYSNGQTADRPHALASGTKSFSCAIAVLGVMDGILRLDEPVSDTIGEWRADPVRSAITIRQLLSLTSGIDGGPIGAPPPYATAIQAPAEFPPGTDFSYGPTPFQIFGELMRRKLGNGADAYFRARVADPIGMTIAFWNSGRDGNAQLPSGVALTAREWARFGELIRQEGRWNGATILDPAILGECFAGSTVNPGYGLTFWLNAPGGLAAEDDDNPTRRLVRPDGRLTISDDAPADLVMAAGAGQQRLYIIPSLDLVVVRQGVLSRYRDDEFLALLLNGSRR